MSEAIFYRSIKPEFVRVIDDDEVVTEVLEEAERAFPSAMLFLAGCYRCDAMLTVAMPVTAEDTREAIAEPLMAPVTIFACPDCLEHNRTKGRTFTEGN